MCEFKCKYPACARKLRVLRPALVILTFMLPVPGAAVLLTTSVIHAVQDDQRKGDQL